MIQQHDEYCATESVEAHIADIEAGWTLRKPWKVDDEEAAERENVQEIRDMLARWEAHGIVVVVREDDPVPA